MPICGCKITKGGRVKKKPRSREICTIMTLIIDDSDKRKQN